MKVVAVQSSPNRDGLTSSLAQAALKGLKDKGGETELIHLNELDLKPCIACDDGWGKCKDERICILEDDFQRLRAKIAESDVLIFATPVYWHDLSESAKIFLDRLRRCERGRDFKTFIGKKAIGIASAGGSGRGAVEEAKILDRQGDHAASSRKYGVATEIFRKAADSMVTESDRQELRPIVCLSQAWQMMTRAEAEASPDLYLKASQLFDEAKEHSFDQKAKILALGHSFFCKALEAGTRFEATRDVAMYLVAKGHLEAAEGYYLKAGFRNASEYARATYMLFDAYMYTHKAETETDPEKKAQYYRMAEKLLQTSVGSYVKAKHPEKSEEIQRLLVGVKEKRQLAVSLTEVLHAPTITSTTSSFSTPTASREQAIGLERFEHADIQATLLLRVKEANVGDDVGLRMELVNAGKAPALLIKVDEITPESFEIGEGGWFESLKLAVYPATPAMMFGWIPYSDFIFGLWVGFFLVPALFYLHKISWGKATAFVTFLMGLQILYVVLSSGGWLIEP